MNIKNYMFRPNPAVIRFSSERVSVFIRSMRSCNDGEISSSVGLIITIIQTVATSYGLNNSNNQNQLRSQ